MRFGLGLTILLGGLTGAACLETPKPLGEALLVVQTDVAVPERVGRLRIDVHDDKGVLVQTREVITPTRDAWPVTFSVVAPDDGAEHQFVVRLRAYPEGHTLSARELDRFAHSPPRNVTVYRSIEELCKDPPLLSFGQPLTLRRGAAPITTILRSNQTNQPDCVHDTRAGSVAARVQITEAATYQFEVIKAVPDGAHNEDGGDTTLSIRTQCLYPTTQLACADDISPENRLSRLVIDLGPGTYFIVTGGDTSAPADLTLLASRVNAVEQVATPPPPSGPSNPGALEPEPGTTIDRLLAVRLTPGVRGDVSLTLSGECFGMPSDLPTRASCIDTAGERRIVRVDAPQGPIKTDIRAVPSAWKGDQPIECTISPRPPSPALDDEVCIFGGAFVLGDQLALVDLEQRAQPERMRVVEPFLMDKYEMSVGRYRSALSRGFKAPDGMPRLNNDPVLDFDSQAPGKGCTWNVDQTTGGPSAGVARETYPLTCVTWATARAVCQFLGGDLPTEDEWEYAATAASGGPEMPYPWGRDLPTCTRTVYARSFPPLDDCVSAGMGPARVDDPILKNGDLSSRGVIGLGGNVQEWLLTAFVPYADRAWELAGLRKPLEEEEAPLRSVRGADWSGFSLYATGSARRVQPASGNFTSVGFRCTRRGR